MKKFNLGRLQNEQGFTLIQAMIGLGLMTSMALGYAAISAQMSKSNATQQVNFERDSLGNYIKSLIRNPDSCKAAVAGVEPITDTVLTVLNAKPTGLEVEFRWPDLTLKKEEKLTKYKVEIENVYVKSLVKNGTTIALENVYQGELILKEKALVKINGSDSFKERSLGPIYLVATMAGAVTQCADFVLSKEAAERLNPGKVATLPPGGPAAAALQAAGITLPAGEYELGSTTSTCDLKCVVDNYYQRNGLSNESKEAFYQTASWQNVATNYSTIVAAMAVASGGSAAGAAAAGNAGWDYEMQNNPLITERTLDGLATAINDVGYSGVAGFYASEGADATAMAASIISANGGYNSGTYSSSDLATVYNAAAAAGITPAQADAFFAGGGTIEQAMAMARGY